MTRYQDGIFWLIVITLLVLLFCLTILFPQFMIICIGIITLILLNWTSIPRKKHGIRIYLERRVDMPRCMFFPDRYYRFRRLSWQWRKLILIVDDEIDIPDSPIIPVQTMVPVGISLQHGELIVAAYKDDYWTGELINYD